MAGLVRRLGKTGLRDGQRLFFCATSTSGLPSRELITCQQTFPHQPLPSLSVSGSSKANTVTMLPFSKKGGQVVSQVAVDVAGFHKLVIAWGCLLLSQPQMRQDFLVVHEAAAQRAFVIFMFNCVAHCFRRPHSKHGAGSCSRQQQRGYF